LAWRVSNTLDAESCITALEEALAAYGPPQIFNPDQGAQYTNEAFTAVLVAHGVPISMDGGKRAVGRKCFCGAPMTQCEVRGCVSADP